MRTLLNADSNTNIARRAFLRCTGVGAIAATGVAAAASCKKHPDETVFNTIDIGAGDVGVLNYAYALKQITAAFYIQLISNPYVETIPAETVLLTDIRDHEVVHREFFKTVLNKDAITSLSVDFSHIDFGKRDNVLSTAQMFEDLCVSAFNGVAYHLQDAVYLNSITKIVSVQARHAAYISSLAGYDGFAGSKAFDINAMDKAQSIAQILLVLNSFLRGKLSARAFNYMP